MLRNRYLEVALTYTRVFPLRLWAVLTGLYLVWITKLNEANYPVQFVVVTLGASLAGWVGPMIAAHAKEQLADWRSKLVPGFRTPHLLVAAVFFVLSVIGFTVLIVARLHQLPVIRGWPALEVSYDGLLAIVLTSTALLVVMAHTQSPVVIAIIIGVTGLLISLGRVQFSQLLAGNSPLLAYPLIVLSIATLIATWIRLACLHEEMFEFWRSESLNSFRLRIPMTGDRFYRRVAANEAGRFTELLRGAGRFDALTSVFDASFLKRANRFRMALGHGGVTWLLPIVIALGIFALYLLQSDSSRQTLVGLLIILPTVLSLTCPVMGTGLIWPQRWYALSTESLFPAQSRSVFLREQGAGMLLEVLRLWVLFTLGAFLTPLLLQPGWVLTAHVAGALLLTGAAQLWIYAACVWLLRLRLNVPINFLAIILIVTAPGFLLAWQMDGGNTDMKAVPNPLCAVVLAIVGVVVACDAYRRWLVTDLD